jgi:hypothetical protein
MEVSGNAHSNTTPNSPLLTGLDPIEGCGIRAAHLHITLRLSEDNYKSDMGQPAREATV